MTDGLRPAPRGKLGAPAHRQELVRPEQAVTARIDGKWVPAVVIAQRQIRDGGAWEVCLEYTPEPGSTTIGWFVADKEHLTGPASDHGE